MHRPVAYPAWAEPSPLVRLRDRWRRSHSSMSSTSSAASSDPAAPQIIITSDSFRKLKLDSKRFDTGSNSTLVGSASGASSATSTDDDRDTYFSPVEYDDDYVKSVVDEDNVNLAETEAATSPRPPTAMDEKTRELLKIQASWGDDSSFVDGADYTFDCEGGDDADITAFMAWKRPSSSHPDERHTPTGDLTPSHARNHSLEYHSPRLSSGYVSEQPQPTPSLSLSTSLPSVSSSSLSSLPSRWAFERPRAARKASLEEEQDLADSSEMVTGAFGISWTTLWVDDMQERVKSSGSNPFGTKEELDDEAPSQSEEREVQKEAEEEDSMDIGDISNSARSRSVASSPTKSKAAESENGSIFSSPSTSPASSPHRPHHPHSRTSFSRSLRQRMAW